MQWHPAESYCCVLTHEQNYCIDIIDYLKGKNTNLSKAYLGV